MDNVTSFQSVVELFLLRYHGRASSAQLEDDDAPGRRDQERNYRMILAYGFDPEFRLALAKELGSDPVMGEWREELGFVMAVEAVLSRNGAWLYDRVVPSERQRQLEVLYPEVFGRANGKAPYSVVELLGAMCSPMGGRDRGLTAIASAIDLLFPEGFDVASAMLAFHRHGAFLGLEPSWMQELHEFQVQLATDLRDLLARLGDRPEVDINQVERVTNPSSYVELIFCISNEAALLRWLRSFSAEDQERVLASSISLSWEEGPLLKALERRFAWSKGLVEGARAAMDAAESYRQYGFSEAALFIYQAMVDDHKVQDRERAEVHNRMAIIHREEGRSHQAFLEFQEAGIIWEVLGAKWEGGVTAAFVAEGYNSEGKRQKAEKYLEEAFAIFSQASEGPEKMARGCLYLAGCADALSRLDLERRALEMGLAFAQSLEDGELFVELNERLISLPR